jgi:geranylgeranyl diphosphate synthase type II
LRTELDEAAGAGVAAASDDDLRAWAHARRAELEALFASRVSAPPSEGDPGRLVEAVRYSLLSAGKRLRPLLALAAADAVGARLDGSVRLACASVELVHCYSLVHDDLPAMDDDDFRRGKPSNHKVFGEAIAILTGDALLTLAFDWIAEAGEQAGRPDDFLRAVSALARGAGMSGMVRGQARDLGEPAPSAMPALERLHHEKTAALFRAALEIGAAAGGADAAATAALAHYGERYGIAFQHADDLDDHDHPELAAAARERVAALAADAVDTVRGAFGGAAQRLEGFALELLRRSRTDMSD